jgi:hypothetical protein
MRQTFLMSLSFLIILVIIGLFYTSEALSGNVDVNIGIGIGVPPPNIVIASPPSVFLIPDSYVYFAPEVGAQLFFYSGYWYILQDGYWFRSSHYRGPWNYLSPSRLPVVFLHLPPDYYRIPLGHKLIPYGQLNKHWKEWEKPQHREVKSWEKSYHEQWKKQDEGWKNWRKEKPGKGRRFN